MNRTWKLSDLEYYALWRSVVEDFLPFPLMFATDIPTDDEFRRELRRTLDEVRGRLNGEFDDALRAITEPDLWIAVTGWDPSDWDNPEHVVRLVGVRRGDRGYLITQLPGRTYWHAGGFTVAECHAVALADAVVGAMPENEAGRLPDITLPGESAAGLDFDYGRSTVRDSFDDSIGDRAQRFLDTPTPYSGTIDVHQGASRFGPRGRVRYRLEWRDLVDDGRYVIDDRIPPVARAVDRAHLINAINTKVAEVIRAIKDERIWQ
ncbi:hypothetical protein BJY24_001720 [Nocardia transvalensis]|uniref:ESAT-6 protein secretion system EspG family protein n=1 Tax=Nocardia transvalensis TaxID=37333 RepID=A0A7W9PBU4_9NOCA|nr:ESX secretion-associated protein EspG [Nocardia transvalensis]MBB5912853.1 hypothetical protein [Nocardia transvalensis]